MNRDQWRMAALAARVKPPGKDGRTIAKVVEVLKAYEAVRDALRGCKTHSARILARKSS